MRTRKHGTQRLEDLASYVGCCSTRFGRIRIYEFRQKVINLLPDLTNRSKECDTIDVGHNCLLNDFPRHLSDQSLSKLVTLCSILFNLCLDELCDTRVYIRRSVTRLKVNLFSSSDIPSKGGVMLQAIARSILVDRQMRDELCRVWKIEGIFELDASGQTLPWVFRRKPPSPTTKRIIHRV